VPMPSPWHDAHLSRDWRPLCSWSAQPIAATFASSGDLPGCIRGPSYIAPFPRFAALAATPSVAASWKASRPRAAHGTAHPAQLQASPRSARQQVRGNPLLAPYHLQIIPASPASGIDTCVGGNCRRAASQVGLRTRPPTPGDRRLLHLLNVPRCELTRNRLAHQQRLDRLSRRSLPRDLRATSPNVTCGQPSAIALSAALAAQDQAQNH